MTQQEIFAGENRDQAGAAHATTKAAKPLLYGPPVGLAIALAFALLVAGQILMFLYYYGDSLADTRLPYAEDFANTTRLDFRQYGGRWRVNDEKLVQFDTQDTDLLAVLPNLELPADEPYAFGTRIQVLAGPKGGGLVFNMQDPESRAMSHMVRFGSGDGGDYLVWGYFDESLNYVAQGSVPPPEFADVVDLAVQVGPETYNVLVNGQPMAQDVPLEYAGGHLALTTWFSSIAFDNVAVNNGMTLPAAPAAQAPAQDAAAPEVAAQDAPAEAPPAAEAPVEAPASADAAPAAPPAGDDGFIDSQPLNSYFTAVLADPAEVGGWRVLDGDWQVQDGALVQLMAEGFDHTIIHPGRFGNYRLRVELQHREGVGGGVVFNVQDGTRNKSGHMIRFMEPGVLAWGYFDPEGNFQGQGGAEVPAAGTDPHVLEVTVDDGTYAVALDGATLAQGIPLMVADGAVGMTASQSAVAFNSFVVEPPQ